MGLPPTSLFQTILVDDLSIFKQDFGDIIPGHGGIMDRFDCQFLMATFVNAYIHSFIRSASPTGNIP